VVGPKSHRFFADKRGAGNPARSGLPAGWTPWYAGPQAAKPAPPFRRMFIILHGALALVACRNQNVSTAPSGRGSAKHGRY